ncbi:MAG: hypothetical protein JJU16_04455 [Alkalibacterium sp.]|nr:hypothetical protein [Alkalibacterium sp.]
MKNKLNRWLVIGLIVSVVVMGIGYVLWANLSPVEDFSALTAVEIRNVQRESAINYPLGDFLLNLGFVGFSSTLLALVSRKIISLIKQT